MHLGHKDGLLETGEVKEIRGQCVGGIFLQDVEAKGVHSPAQKGVTGKTVLLLATHQL